MEDSEESPFPRWMEGDSLAPPCNVEEDIVEEILDFAEVCRNDVVYDLGCGDGRLCIAAAERGSRACGVEIEEDLIMKFDREVIARNLQDRVRVIHGDLLAVDLSDATVILLYLLPEAIEALREALIKKLEDGCRIVCNTWGLKGLPAVKQLGAGRFQQVNLFLYTKESLLTTSSQIKETS